MCVECSWGWAHACRGFRQVWGPAQVYSPDLSQKQQQRSKPNKNLPKTTTTKQSKPTKNTHMCTIPQNQKPSVTSYSCLQTLGVCWTGAVLKAGFLLPYICCSFSQKVPKMARGRKLGIPVSTQQLHIITKDLLEMHIYAYTDLHLYMAVDVPHLKGQFVRKLFVHQNCRCKENKYQLIPPPRKPNNKKPLQSH